MGTHQMQTHFHTNMHSIPPKKDENVINDTNKHTMKNKWPPPPQINDINKQKIKKIGKKSPPPNAHTHTCIKGKFPLTCSLKAAECLSTQLTKNTRISVYQNVNKGSDMHTAPLAAGGETLCKVKPKLTPGSVRLDIADAETEEPCAQNRDLSQASSLKA